MQLTKFFIFPFLFSFLCSCAVKPQQEVINDDFIIFKKVIEDKNLINTYIIREADTKGLMSLIKEEYPTFFDMWEYNSFQNFIPLETAKKIFNDVEVENYYKQLENSHEWPSYFSEKFISRDSLINSRDDAFKNKDFFFFGSISKIIYTTHKDYALVFYDYTDILTKSNGEGGLLIYKKENKEWKYLTQLFYSIQ